ncbi:hypothetical protein AXG93_1881s1010 [Marchantia polymorpha subsp. ruderalis]|uniref:Uncharacterized protein n=1 Tax=Marchantia polymorpha subsp. ruderalis TaxID=1480154 RepID=A0A176W5C9_MARPO|nr:hypothetical protein AXG93_1881s1010 [Marchantia polymorpha subsp. ruderalis]
MGNIKEMFLPRECTLDMGGQPFSVYKVTSCRCGPEAGPPGVYGHGHVHGRIAGTLAPEQNALVNPRPSLRRCRSEIWDTYTYKGKH